MNIRDLKPKRVKPKTYWELLKAMPNDLRQYYTWGNDREFGKVGDRYLQNQITLAELQDVYARMIAGPISAIPGTNPTPTISSPDSSPASGQA